MCLQRPTIDIDYLSQCRARTGIRCEAGAPHRLIARPRQSNTQSASTHGQIRVGARFFLTPVVCVRAPRSERRTSGDELKVV